MGEQKQKFYFIPVTKEKRAEEEKEFECSIFAGGYLRLGVSVMKHFVDKRKFVRILLDIEQRTLGLYFGDEGRTAFDNAWRSITRPKKWPSTGTVAVGNIMNMLGIKGYTITNLKMKPYADKTYGKILYFQLPTKKMLDLKVKPKEEDERN